MFTPLTSKTLEKAQRRLNGLKYLNPTFDLGNGANVENLAAQTARMQAKLAAHNALVQQLNAEMAASREELRAIERNLAQISERMLTCVAGFYGKDSDEYEIAGGTKRSTQSTATPSIATLPAPNLPAPNLSIADPLPPTQQGCEDLLQPETSHESWNECPSERSPASLNQPAQTENQQTIDPAIIPLPAADLAAAIDHRNASTTETLKALRQPLQGRKQRQIIQLFNAIDCVAIDTPRRERTRILGSTNDLKIHYPCGNASTFQPCHRTN